MSFKDIRLNDRNGYEIHKLWEVSEITGKVFKDTLQYWVCDEDWMINGFDTLEEAHRYADSI